MRKIYLLLSALLLCFCDAQARKTKTEDDNSTLMLRLSIHNTRTEEAWNDMLSALRQAPGCCDEVWFSTGISMPSMKVHEQNAERLKRAKETLRQMGIATSLQVQMTIGHGDDLGQTEDWTSKTWTGWTGSTGVEAKYCNCPRQPDYLEYVRLMSRIYAQVHPRTIWIDDDLRYDNHQPATIDSRIGCWCQTCVSAFGAQEQKAWTRESLNEAMANDPALEKRWQLFSIKALQRVARIIAEETHAVSPETRMGYQKTFIDDDTTVVKAVLQTLYEVSGQKVRYRAGGGAYYDRYQPVEQILKSMWAARFKSVLGSPDYVESWCPEVESYPRHYGSRTAQSVLLEGFAALAFGMDDVSMYVTDRGAESPDLKARSMLCPLADGAPVLRAYARANRGTQAVGFRSAIGLRSLFEFGLTTLPILTGEGKNLAVLDEDALRRVSIYGQPSAKIQEYRNEISEKYALPVLCQSPFVGQVFPRVTADGALRTVGIINCRIDEQGPIRLSLPALPKDTKKALWREMKKKSVRLKIFRDENDTPYVVVPSIQAWNAGFLEF